MKLFKGLGKSGGVILIYRNIYKYRLPNYWMGEEGELSSFNEGALQMRRIDELQRRLNLLNVDSLGFNIFTQQYNYHTVFKTLNSLFSEASSKLKSTELKEGDRMRKIISEVMLFKPVFYYKVEQSMGKARVIKQVNNNNWDLLQEVLFKYELLIRHYLEEHNLTSPKEEVEEGWD